MQLEEAKFSYSLTCPVTDNKDLKCSVINSEASSSVWNEWTEVDTKRWGFIAITNLICKKWLNMVQGHESDLCCIRHCTSTREQQKSVHVKDETK